MAWTFCFPGKLKAKELIPFLSDFAAPPGTEEDDPEEGTSGDSAEGKVVPQVRAFPSSCNASQLFDS
jgi:hypothetical protein